MTTVQVNSIKELPRSLIALLFVLDKLPQEGATYRGLRIALGMESDNGIRTLVKFARQYGIVAVIQTGAGRGAKANIRISEHGNKLIQTLGIKETESKDGT